MTHALFHSTTARMLLAVAAGLTMLLAGAASAQVTYTEQQATQGATAFSANCATCHGDKAQGAEAPPLTGGQFDGIWRGGPVKDLLTFIAENMPADKPGSLRKDVYLVVTAFIMSINKIPAGATALPADPPATMLIPK